MLKRSAFCKNISLAALLIMFWNLGSMEALQVDVEAYGNDPISAMAVIRKPLNNPPLASPQKPLAKGPSTPRPLEITKTLSVENSASGLPRTSSLQDLDNMPLQRSIAAPTRKPQPLPRAVAEKALPEDDPAEDAENFNVAENFRPGIVKNIDENAGGGDDLQFVGKLQYQERKYDKRQTLLEEKLSHVPPSEPIGNLMPNNVFGMTRRDQGSFDRQKGDFFEGSVKVPFSPTKEPQQPVQKPSRALPAFSRRNISNFPKNDRMSDSMASQVLGSGSTTPRPAKLATKSRPF